MATEFADRDVQIELLRRMVSDRIFLRDAGHLLSPDDFKPIGKSEQPDLFMVATVSLRFWNKYKEPIGKLLPAQLNDSLLREGWARKNREERIAWAKRKFVGRKFSGMSLALVDYVKQYKKEIRLAQALEKVTDLQSSGQLTTEKFGELAREAIGDPDSEFATTDFFDKKELERRIARRKFQLSKNRAPAWLIDPLDAKIDGLRRGKLGLWMAPYGRGKSLALMHQACMYSLQGWAVLYFTLEDTLEEQEDRLDAMVTELPLSRLSDYEASLRRRFQRHLVMLKSRLKIVDCTTQSWTVGAIESKWEQERANGFTADAILIDYDNEIQPEKKNHKERRFEFAEIYMGLRRMAARTQTIVWTASQSGRKSKEKKIITGLDVSEDIGKLQKVWQCLTLGRGEWGENSLFLWVEKNRQGRKEFGMNIMTDMERMIFYDREATGRRERMKSDEEVEA